MKKPRKAANSLNPQQQALAAALLAYSNMGMGKPCQTELDHAMRRPSTSVAEIITGFAGSICENDEMLDGFIEEAKDWLNTVKKYSDLEMKQFHGDIWHVASSLEVLLCTACGQAMKQTAGCVNFQCWDSLQNTGKSRQAVKLAYAKKLAEVL